MFLYQIISEDTLIELKELFLVENRSFVMATVGYPILASIVTAIVLYILVKRQQLIRSYIVRIINLLEILLKYNNKRQTKIKIRGTCSSLRKKKTINKSGAFDSASMFVGGIIIVSIITKKLFFAVVLTQSMAPLIAPGDLIVSEAYTKNITVGDVIVFTPPNTNKPYVHRVISVSDSGIRTKGDNSNPDSWLLKDKQIQGKAISINQKPFVLRGLGYYFLPINSPEMATDVKYNTVRTIITAMQTFGPFIALIIMFFVLLPAGKRS